MPRGIAPRSLSIVILALIACLYDVGPSAANGPCGQDFDGNHACGITSPATIAGTLTTDNEKDYYVFYARKGTEISITVTDTEAATCSESFSCGSADVQLLEANGDAVDEGASSEPHDGITVPGSFDHTLEASGTYYVVVSGSLGRSESTDNPTPVPYTLSVNASPAVQWPPPAPPTRKILRCTVKRIRHHHHVTRVRSCHTVVLSG